MKTSAVFSRIVVWLSALALLMACGKPAAQTPAADRPTEASAVEAKPAVKIGFSMDTLKEERWSLDKAMVEERARQAGAQIEVAVANGDDALQTSQCRTMLENGANVLIIAPHDAEAAAAIVKMAHEKGVPVVSYDRLIENADVDVYVSHKVNRIGAMQAEYALQRIPKGNYVLIGGAPTDNNAHLLREGQMKALQPAIDRGDVKIISDQFAREWLPEEAARITAEALARSGNAIDAIVASNDGTAGGAIAALSKAGLAGKVLVTGQDAEQKAVQRILDGSQMMTIYKPIQPEAFSAVDAAIGLVRKQSLQTTGTVNNGQKDVPAILHDPMIIDKANISRLPQRKAS